MRENDEVDRYVAQTRREGRSTHGPRSTIGVTTATLTLVTTIFTLAIAVIVAMPGQAGADSPQIAQIWVHGSQVSASPVPQLPPQESVEVKVPANSVLQPGLRADILMCSDPGARPSNLPINDSTCDGLTINVGRTLDIGTGGMVDKKDYVIYPLPLKIEPGDSIPVCNSTHACVLYIGQDQNDFERPHVWSTAFYVGSGPSQKASYVAASSSGSSTPLVVGIVLAAILVGAGGFVWFRRRERGQRHSVT
jgi:hypothetical protein